MGIETSIAAAAKAKDISDLSVQSTPNSSGKSSHKNKQHHSRKMSPVQNLFNACKGVFANGGPDFIPLSEDVERLSSILDNLKAADVGLSPEMPYFGLVKNERSSIITYLHLYECDKFSIGIFCLPPSGVLPLHNHPGMTVFSKLLFGTMHIKSYDWADGEPCTATVSEDAPGARLAKLKVNADLVAPCSTSILYPAAGGNMHCFTAVTACAVLDVQGPPFSDPDGRHCTYYREYPIDRFPVDEIPVAKNEKDGFAWLQERDNPEEFIVCAAPYRGPKIVDS